MTNENVVLIIPTYNESAVIRQTISALSDIRSQLKNKQLNVLIFDSASTDLTVEIVKNMQADYDWLYLQQESKKSGLGSAYYQAMQYALKQLNADVVIEFDADLSHQPKYLLPMLEKIDTYDVVIGSRYVRGGRLPADWAFYRKLISTMGNWVSRMVLSQKYKDFTSGFRATRKNSLIQVLNIPFISPNYGYKLDLLWRLHLLNARILEIPIEFVDREKGQSKLPRNSIVESLGVIFKLRFNPLFHKAFQFLGK